MALHFKYDQARRRFVEWAQNEIAVVPDFHKRILFSDEAHFWLNGYVNKQNCRIWSEANPQVSCGSIKTAQHVTQLCHKSIRICSSAVSASRQCNCDEVGLFPLIAKRRCR
ncbi:hypothetical protein TNCV_404791 [Trichonephila clavipes]|nr:hypothetical protein TNCV_404791 [Trichonephila clavipes]